MYFAHLFPACFTYLDVFAAEPDPSLEEQSIDKAEADTDCRIGVSVSVCYNNDPVALD